MRLSWIPGGVLLALPALACAAEAPAPAVSTAGSLLQVFIGLVAILLLIGATAWLAQRLGVARGSAGGLLHVVASTAVGTRERVVVIEVGEQWLIVGVAAGSVSTLATLPKGTVPDAPAPARGGPFAARLQQLIESRRGK